MLHCLDFVRRMTWRDHYSEDAYFQENDFGVRRHAGTFTSSLLLYDSVEVGFVKPKETHR
jgi:hypothetical protein